MTSEWADEGRLIGKDVNQVSAGFAIGGMYISRVTLLSLASTFTPFLDIYRLSERARS